MTKLLEGKNAIVYGGGGGIGAGVAKTFAREGATVFLVGRTTATLQKVADEITSGGGRAQVAVLDHPDIPLHTNGSENDATASTPFARSTW